VVVSGTPFYHRSLIRWTASTVGHVTEYRIERKRDGAADTSYTQIGTSSTNYFIDPEELPDGQQFTYRARAKFDDVSSGQLSGWSQPVTTTAVNNRPLAAADSYTILNNATLTVPAPGVLVNDADSDSPSAFIGRRVVLVTTTTNGTLVLNTTTGEFTYTPKSGFVGSDSFKYKANDGPWSGDTAVPLSADSDIVTVSITVKKK
jgi:hypothetical protein